ncbi:MAG: MCE family protein [Prevotella sp.]|nr:MCE family protein [Prevotella sp.]MBQ9650194.1 MCE family protein [Prevotella sp.]
MKKFSKEIQIALVAIVGVIVLYYGMQFLKGLSLSTDTNYYVKFKDISGLSASSPVYANGYRVGVVEDIIYDYDGQSDIVAVVGINNEMRMPQGTTADIVSDLLGNIKLELRLGDRAAGILAAGDTITGGQEQGAMAKAAEIIPQVQSLLPKLDSILVSVNALLADPAIANSLHNIDQITSSLTSTSHELNRLSASLNHQMPQMLENADGLLANTNSLTRNLNELDLAGTMQKVDNTLRNVEQMTAKLNSNEGTLGLLMRDPGLYNNLNATMVHADSLMIDLKQHPKRYVHFSVFGKKDK